MKFIGFFSVTTYSYARERERERESIQLYNQAKVNHMCFLILNVFLS